MPRPSKTTTSMKTAPGSSSSRWRRGIAKRIEQTFLPDDAERSSGSAARRPIAVTRFMTTTPFRPRTRGHVADKTCSAGDGAARERRSKSSDGSSTREPGAEARNHPEGSSDASSLIARERTRRSRQEAARVLCRRPSPDVSDPWTTLARGSARFGRARPMGGRRAVATRLRRRSASWPSPRTPPSLRGGRERDALALEAKPRQSPQCGALEALRLGGADRQADAQRVVDVDARDCAAAGPADLPVAGPQGAPATTLRACVTWAQPCSYARTGALRGRAI